MARMKDPFPSPHLLVLCPSCECSTSSNQATARISRLIMAQSTPHISTRSCRCARDHGNAGFLHAHSCSTSGEEAALCNGLHLPMGEFFPAIVLDRFPNPTPWPLYALGGSTVSVILEYLCSIVRQALATWLLLWINSVTLPPHPGSNRTPMHWSHNWHEPE